MNDNFTLDLNRVERICDLIIERKINVPLQCWNGVRVDRISKKLLEKMKKAGIWLVSISPETGSPDTLLKIKKRFTLEQVKQARAWCKELGIVTVSLYMLGFPWEDRKQIQQTLDFAHELDTEFVCFCVTYPQKGTELYEQVKAQSQLEIEKYFCKIKLKDIDQEEIKKMTKKFYIKFYLRPKKIMQLLFAVPLGNLIKTFKHYSHRVKNTYDIY